MADGYRPFNDFFNIPGNEQHLTEMMKRQPEEAARYLLNNINLSATQVALVERAINAKPRLQTEAWGAVGQHLLGARAEDNAKMTMGRRVEAYQLGSTSGNPDGFSYPGQPFYNDYDKGIGNRQRAIVVPVGKYGNVFGNVDAVSFDSKGKVNGVIDIKAHSLFNNRTDYLDSVNNYGFKATQDLIRKAAAAQGEKYASGMQTGLYAMGFGLNPSAGQYHVYGLGYPEQDPSEAIFAGSFATKSSRAQIMQRVENVMKALTNKALVSPSFAKALASNSAKFDKAGLTSDSDYFDRGANGASMEDRAYQDAKDLLGVDVPPSVAANNYEEAARDLTAAIKKVQINTSNLPPKGRGSNISAWEKWQHYTKMRDIDPKDTTWGGPTALGEPDANDRYIKGRWRIEEAKKIETDEVNARKELIGAIKEEGKLRQAEYGATKNVLGALGSTRSEFYNWPAWQQTRLSQWSGIKAAGAGILPSFLERPLGHIGDSYLAMRSAQNAPLIGLQNAFQQGIVPMAMSGVNIANGSGMMSAGRALSTIGGSAATGAGAGLWAGGLGAILGGVAGLAAGATQVIGNIGQAKINEQGFEIQSRLHLLNAAVGLGKDVHSMIHNIIMTPFKLLGNTIKWGIPIFTGLFTAARSLMGRELNKTEQNLGRPNLVYTGDMETSGGVAEAWYNYTWSRAGDSLLGLQDGTTQANMEQLERIRKGIFRGMIPQEGELVAQALIGEMGLTFDSSDPKKAFENYNKLLGRLGTDLDASKLAAIGAFNPVLEQSVSQLKQLGYPDITSALESMNGGRIGSLVNEWYAVQGSPNQMYATKTEYDMNRRIQDTQRMKIANNWWEYAGRGMEEWWRKFLEKLEVMSRDRSLASAKDVGGHLIYGGIRVAGEAGRALGGIGASLFGVTGEDGSVRMPTLSEAWDKAKGLIAPLLTEALKLYTTAWIEIAATGYDIVSKIAGSIWDKFYDLFDRLSSIDMRKLFTNWVTKNPDGIFDGVFGERATYENLLDSSSVGSRRYRNIFVGSEWQRIYGNFLGAAGGDSITGEGFNPSVQQDIIFGASQRGKLFDPSDNKLTWAEIVQNALLAGDNASGGTTLNVVSLLERALRDTDNIKEIWGLPGSGSTASSLRMYGYGNDAEYRNRLADQLATASRPSWALDLTGEDIRNTLYAGRNNMLGEAVNGILGLADGIIAALEAALGGDAAKMLGDKVRELAEATNKLAEEANKSAEEARYSNEYNFGKMYDLRHARFASDVVSRNQVPAAGGI
jgi:hypothetical protein